LIFIKKYVIIKWEAKFSDRDFQLIVKPYADSRSAPGETRPRFRENLAYAKSR
jgi:hypothetical protein